MLPIAILIDAVNYERIFEERNPQVNIGNEIQLVIKNSAFSRHFEALTY